MSLINDIFGVENTQTTFKIYTNQVIQDASDTNPNVEPAIEFTALESFAQSNDSTVAFEPLEDGQFSSDSKQLKPGQVNISCFYSPVLTNETKSKADKNKQIKYVIDTLSNYQRSTELLTIIQDDTIFTTHPNLALINFSYKQDEYSPILYVYLNFQEIRIQNSEYGKMPVNKVSNPQSSTAVTNNASLKSPAKTTTDSLGL